MKAPIQIILYDLMGFFFLIKKRYLYFFYESYKMSFCGG